MNGSKLYLELASHIDVKKELERLNKKLEEVNKLKANLEVKLNDKNRDKVPEAVRQKEDAQWQKFLED